MTDLEAIAAALQDAYATRVPLPPLHESYDGLTLDDAYAIQQIQVRRWMAKDARVVGFKVGLTSDAMRRQLGVYEPDFGHLLSDMVYAADAPIATDRHLQPRAEPEIALVLGRPLRRPGVSVSDVVAATAYALPAIEIIDSRIADWRIGLVDTVADNASSGGFVLGQTPTLLDRFDPALTGCVFRHNGRIVGTGAGAAVLGSPLHAATWLANELLGRGAELDEGYVILTGSVTAAVPVAAGDTVTATFDRLGTVTALFD
jgi:2-keto-4-pentenoate hydratase